MIQVQTGRPQVVPDVRGWAASATVATGYVQAAGLLLVGLAAVVPAARGTVGLDDTGIVSEGILLGTLGLASMVACVALWLGHSPALLPLVVVGAAGTVVLMAVGSWMAFVVSSSVAALLLLDLLVPGGRREQVRPGEAD